MIEDETMTSYIDETVSPGKIYEYAVRAYSGDEKSSYTAVKRATISKPKILVKNLGDGIEISWDEINEAEGYYVYRKEENGQYKVIQKMISSKSTTYLDREVEVISGKKYTYAVRAYIGEHKSSYLPVDIVIE
mgnify:CR=1 FL=1